MAHRCFSCRKQAWNSAAEEAASQTSSALLQEPFGPWALPYYPRLGDPFQHSPDFSFDSTHCFCGLSCCNCSGCGRLFKARSLPCPECPESQPTAPARMEPRAASGGAGAAESASKGDRSPGGTGQTDALATLQETETDDSRDLPALQPEELTLEPPP